ncbi:hypothetical protein EJ04DRAFT_514966 [Polyplosphaeria fusca]|uniref:Uncharacterized protein n=1 Tax=Polyplosphaeria fusca TaxID=682080 RepID=A0A9P4QQW3_9PLEO|nr:hypothetical protein EJ04DRAFT_514966 [Polyplosphaeria fusca]
MLWMWSLELGSRLRPHHKAARRIGAHAAWWRPGGASPGLAQTEERVAAEDEGDGTRDRELRGCASACGCGHRGLRTVDAVQCSASSSNCTSHPLAPVGLVPPCRPTASRDAQHRHPIPSSPATPASRRKSSTRHWAQPRPGLVDHSQAGGTTGWKRWKPREVNDQHSLHHSTTPPIPPPHPRPWPRPSAAAPVPFLARAGTGSQQASDARVVPNGHDPSRRRHLTPRPSLRHGRRPQLTSSPSPWRATIRQWLACPSNVGRQAQTRPSHTGLIRGLTGSSVADGLLEAVHASPSLPCPAHHAGPHDGRGAVHAKPALPVASHRTAWLSFFSERAVAVSSDRCAIWPWPLARAHFRLHSRPSTYTIHSR